MNESADRKKVFANLIASLKKDLGKKGKILEHTKRASQEAPSAMESHSDTTREVMGRLAESQTKLIVQTEKIIHHLDKLSGGAPDARIAEGSIVELTTGQNKLFYLLTSMGGGLSVDSGKDTVRTLNTDSAIGKSLMGKKPGSIVAILNNKFKITSIT